MSGTANPASRMNLCPAANQRRKWELLGWLFLTFFLYYGDRAVFGVLIGSMADTLQLSSSQLGLANTLMFVAIALMMPFAGFVGDNLNRKWAIVISLAAWSLGTVLTGTAGGFVSLILFRSLLTGCGESFYTPSAYSLLAEKHEESRGRAMAVHQAALYIGVISSGVFGGWIATRWGWRWAFFAFGGAGLLLAVALACRLESDTPRSKTRSLLRAAMAGLAVLWKHPVARIYCLSFAVIVCVVNAYITWAPRLLQAKYGLDTGSAGAYALGWHHLAALISVISGGYFSDRLVRHFSQARIGMMLGALIIMTFCLWWIGSAPGALSAYGAITVLGFARGAYECNTHASLFEVVPADLRAAVVSMFAMIAFMVGSVSPWAFGQLAELHGLAAGLSLGFKGLAGLTVLAAAGLTYVFLTHKSSFPRRI